MTLPFENDTSRIVKKYAKHSISQSRVKTFLSVLTIALAVALLSGFALSVIGMETEAKRELLVSSQMLYHNLNDEQMQTLRHDERISDSKIYMQAANTQIENYLVIPVYIEQNNSQIVMDEIVEGQYPISWWNTPTGSCPAKRPRLFTSCSLSMRKIPVPECCGRLCCKRALT